MNVNSSVGIEAVAKLLDKMVSAERNERYSLKHSTKLLGNHE